MATQINLSEISGPFRLARTNKLHVSRRRLAKTLDIPYNDIMRFERGEVCLAPETLELIFGAGMMLIIMAIENKKQWHNFYSVACGNIKTPNKGRVKINWFWG